MKKLVDGICLFTMLTIVTIPALSAASIYVSGGNWTYGVTGGGSGTVYSNYYHSSKSHSASVINARGTEDKSGWVSKGKTASASLKAYWGTDSSFYNVK